MQLDRGRVPAGRHSMATIKVKQIRAAKVWDRDRLAVLQLFSSLRPVHRTSQTQIHEHNQVQLDAWNLVQHVGMQREDLYDARDFIHRLSLGSSTRIQEEPSTDVYLLHQGAEVDDLSSSVHLHHLFKCVPPGSNHRASFSSLSRLHVSLCLR